MRSKLFPFSDICSKYSNWFECYKLLQDIFLNLFYIDAISTFKNKIQIYAIHYTVHQTFIKPFKIEKNV